MNKLQYPSREEVVDTWHYQSGRLYWRRPGKARKMGEPIGCIKPDGYVRATRKGWMVHRLIWVYHFGPIEQGYEIDHINRDRADNRIENLRVVTRSQNHINRTPKPGRNLPKGVYKVFRNYALQKPYRATHCGKEIGYFRTPEEAHNAYLEMARKPVHISD